MTAHPFEQIGGMTTTGNVPKPDFVSFAKARIPVVMADASEVASTTLANQQIVMLKSNGRQYRVNTADTTTAADGVTLIRDANNLAFNLMNSPPQIFAWDNGVPGDGTDQTTALQTIVDGIGVNSGAEILIKGLVRSSALNLSGKRNITLRGVGSGQGAGASQKSMLFMTTGAVGFGAPAINCRQTTNAVFKDMYLYGENAAFNGSLIDCGGTTLATAGSGAVYMGIENCIIYTAASAATGLSLYGATNGNFSRTNFGGPGTHIRLQDDIYSNVGYCNANTFDTLTFVPSGTNYPIFGSAEALTMIGCCWEPGSDGRIRAMQTSSNRPFKSLKIINPSTFDATIGGNEAFVFPWGYGLDIGGGLIGAPTPGYGFALGGGGGAHGDPEVRGLQGVKISGVHINPCTALMDFYGTKALKTNVRGIKVSGNPVINGQLIGTGYTEVENGEFGPNNVYGSPNALGASKMYVGFPRYTDRAAAVAAGLTSDQMFIATGSLNALQLV